MQKFFYMKKIITLILPYLVFLCLLFLSIFILPKSIKTISIVCSALIYAILKLYIKRKKSTL